MADKSKKPKITINVMEPLDIPSPIQQLAAQTANMMSCRNCGGLMFAGTQCQRCGAWCR